MGIAGDLTLVGKDLIRLLLGPGWEPAGQIFTFFAPGIGIMLVYGTHGWIHLSIGRADRWFLWGLVEWVVSVLLFIAGLHWGPKGVAVAWDLSLWILVVPAMWYAGKPIGLGISHLLGEVWRYIVASLLAGVTCSLLLAHCALLSGVTGASGAAVRIVSVSVSFVLLYLLGIVLLHRSFAPLRSAVNLFREMVSMNKQPSAANAG
jgi:PST family polysaccharide transporter